MKLLSHLQVKHRDKSSQACSKISEKRRWRRRRTIRDGTYMRHHAFEDDQTCVWPSSFAQVLHDLDAWAIRPVMEDKAKDVNRRGLGQLRLEKVLAYTR
jgi:hypothetical protein